MGEMSSYAIDLRSSRRPRLPKPSSATRRSRKINQAKKIIEGRQKADEE